MTDSELRERHGKSLRFLFTRVPFTATVGLELVDWSEPDVAGAIATLIDTAGSAAAWNGHNYDIGTRGATVTMTVKLTAGLPCWVAAQP